MHLLHSNVIHHVRQKNVLFNNKIKEGAINTLGSHVEQPCLFCTAAIHIYYLMPIPLVLAISHNISIPRHSI